MLKTTTFTMMHFTIAFSVTWALTGDWRIGGAVALIEPLVNSVGYFFHEKVWQRLETQNSKPTHKWAHFDRAALVKTGHRHLNA